MVASLPLALAIVAASALSCQSGDAIGLTDPPLEGTLWEFVEIDGDTVAHFDNEEIPRLRLLPKDHSIDAWLSCNLFNGHYEMDGGQLTLRPAPVSWRDCVTSHEQEETIRRVLQRVTRYRIEGERLYLSDDERVLAILMATSTAD